MTVKTKTLKIDLDTRDGEPIEFEGNVTKVSKGCEVELRKDGIPISAKVVEYTAGKPGVATVIEFPEGGENQIPQLKVGTAVEFRDQHVFRCAA